MRQQPAQAQAQAQTTAQVLVLGQPRQTEHALWGQARWNYWLLQ
jgi:hypothetical protein